MVVNKMQIIVKQFSIFLVGVLLSPSLWAGPAIQSWETANGAKVLFVEAPELPMVDIRVLFDAGSARDGEKSGLAKLTSALLSQGAGEWDADQLAERVESVGANFGAGSARDMAWVTVRTLTEAKALDMAIDTMSVVLASPRFDVADFKRVREAMQIGLRQSEQNPGSVVSKAFMAELFKGHPYASHPGGTQESLEVITRDDLIAMHKQYYVARNAVVAIVGAVSRVQAEALAERITVGLAKGTHAPDLPEVAVVEAGRTKHISFPSSQSHIQLGQPGIRRGDSDHYVLYVGNHILGGSGLVSLLSEEVREKRGLSYSAYSYFNPMRQLGPFIIGAQTQNSKAVEALDVIRKTLQNFIDNGPTQKQLTASKQNITGGFPLRVASNRSIVEYLAMLGFYDLPLDYLDTFVDRVNEVTVEQIRDAFKQRIHPDKLITVIVGKSEVISSD